MGLAAAIAARKMGGPVDTRRFRKDQMADKTKGLVGSIADARSPESLNLGADIRQQYMSFAPEDMARPVMQGGLGWEQTPEQKEMAALVAEHGGIRATRAWDPGH